MALAAKGIKGEKLLPPLNSTLLRTFGTIYEGGRQFTSKQQLWEDILTLCKEIQAENAQNLTNLMGARIVNVI